MFEDDNEVGYKKPPKDTQFKRGVSGNPKGRPKGSKNHSTLFKELADERVTVTEGGKKKTMRRAELIFRQVINTASTGKNTGVRDYLHYSKMFLPIEIDEDESTDVRAQDRRIVENFHKRRERLALEQSDSPTPDNGTEPKADGDSGILNDDTSEPKEEK